MCKKCQFGLSYCNNDFKKCFYLQAHCYWCNNPIYETSMYDVKTFWNQTYHGYPICDQCSKGLKTNGSISYNKFRKSLGLKPEKREKRKNTIEKWL